MDFPDVSTLYTEYRPKVMGYIYARLRSREDAEDLCQDVFEKVMMKLDTYDPEKSSISTWIYTITRNSVIDFYKRNHQSAELDENMAEDGFVDDALLKNETLDELASALEMLPDELQEIIVLRYYDGIPLTEISDKMGLSYGAVKLRHAKAVEMLRRAMHIA